MVFTSLPDMSEVVEFAPRFEDWEDFFMKVATKGDVWERMSNGKLGGETLNIFHFHLYLGEWCILTNTFADRLVQPPPRVGCWVFSQQQ